MPGTFRVRMKNLRLLSIGIVIACAFSIIGESDTATEPLDTKQLQTKLSTDWGFEVTSIKPTKVAGLYQFETGEMEILYTDSEGLHVFAGQMYRLIQSEQYVNLTEIELATRRNAILATTDNIRAISFPPEGEARAVVHVFTDVDCHFCRELHKAIDEYNAIGLEVRYLAFPRSGVGGSTYERMVSAWCSDNPQESITRLKADKVIANLVCENPVAEHYELGKRFGITGTPAIIMPNGHLVSGFLPAEKLETMLN